MLRCYRAISKYGAISKVPGVFLLCGVLNTTLKVLFALLRTSVC